MSRLRRATVAASFGYLQYGLAMASGLLMVPLAIRCLGPRTYGLWLASGELLGYAAMVDLGVVAVLPWMLAEADGRQDRDAMRRLVSHGVVVGAAVGLVYGLLAMALWLVLPSALGLSAGDRRAVGPPLALLVGTLMVAYPLRVFSAIVIGLQDVTFNGGLAVAQSGLNVAITATMLIAGFGLYAPATGAAVAALASVLASAWRVRVLAPDLLRDWPRPNAAGLRMLLTNGLGAWSGALGWQLQSASSGLVISALGRPEWIAVYACTSKLIALATQLAWVIPDAGLVGLAQVHGEQPAAARLRSLVLLMLRLHLLLAGGAACGLVVFNPVFVPRWVGAELFAGATVSTLLALGIVISSLVHGVMTAAAVVGNRVRVGAISLVNGAVQVATGWLFGRWWGLEGVAAASLVAGLVVAVPAGARLLRHATGLTISLVWTEVVRPWGVRAVPLIATAVVLGGPLASRRLPVALAIAAAVGLVYLRQMGPLLGALPIDRRWARWLVPMPVAPAPSAPAATMGQG